MVIGAWLALALALAPLLPALEERAADESDTFLVRGSESAEAERLIEERFRSGSEMAAVIAYFRDGGLTGPDEDRMEADAYELCESAQIPSLTRVGTPQLLACGQTDPLDVGPALARSPDGSIGLGAALMSDDSTPVAEAAVEAIRAVVPPPEGDRTGLRAYVTGEAGFEADRSAAVEGIDETLLGITVAALLVLLLAIYRSPLVALVPLVVVGLAYVVAAGVTYGLVAAGLTTISGQTTAILIVLMFGAGTDYCLLIVARFRDELRRTADVHEAMARASERTGPAILSAGAIVVVAMLVLALADFNATREMGPILALGVAIMVAAGLTLLPAILAALGERSLPAPAAPSRLWSAVGRLVSRRPAPVAAAVTLLLLAGGPGALGGREPLDFSEAFREAPESVQGQQLVRDRFIPGRAAPTSVVVEAGSAEPVIAALTRGLETPVEEMYLTTRSPRGDLTLAEAHLKMDPFSDAATDAVPGLRATARAAAGGGPVLVGGETAEAYDTREALARDTRLIAPVGLAAILLILGVLLRAVVMPLYVVATVILSFAFALFVYYSPRNPAWPTNNDVPQIVVGYNQISRFTLNADGTAVVPDSERVILRVPKAKISGSPSGFPGGPVDSGPGHVGGAGLDFDADGNLYLGVGDDVSPNAPGHGRYTPMDYRAAERWDARKTSANSADLRGKILRIRPVEDIPADAEPGVDATYTIPAGNMFAPGTPQTRPEIYAMGFRQPFTVHADPSGSGRVVVGEYCHDASTNQADRAPAGVCEWNLVDEPAFHGWPFCMGDNAPINSSFRWDYAGNESTGEQHDCSQSEIPSDIEWAPADQTAAPPTFDGLDTLPGPAAKATVWMKGGAEGGPGPLEFGDLSAGGRSPVTGPIYRYDADTAGPGAFPAYYDGSWLITNRGTNNGFWKEVRLRSDDNEMLRVNDWIPAGGFGAPNNAFVIPSKFGPDGALYMATWTNGCCRNQLSADTNTQLIKIESAVQDQCLEDTQPPTANHRVEGREHPDEEGTYLDSASLILTAGDAGCAGVESIEYRVNSDSEDEWQAYSEPVEFAEPGTYTVDYRATDEFDNVSAVEEATFTVVHIDDQDAPAVTGTLSGSQNADGHYVAPATLTVEATDGLSPISSIEYRDNQVEEWSKVDVEGEELTAQIQEQFNETAFHYVEFRATDDAGNVSEPESVAFSVTGTCVYPGSDEFDGTELDAGWLRHEREGGTPTTGEMAPTLGGGQLTMPTHDSELDGGATGPVNFLGQDLHSMGDDWEVETQLTVEHHGGWQFAGLMIWNGDNNLFRSTITHNQGNGSIYVEQSKDNPPSVEGSRQQSGQLTVTDAPEPITIKMRYGRADGANTVTAQYRIVAPANLANADWVDFPDAPEFNDLNPAGGPRRDGEGSRIGLLAAGNFGAEPTDVVFDYFRVTRGPGEATCPEDDVIPPATAASGAEDGGVYDEPVELTLSASDDDGENATGVAVTEYRVDGGPWQESENTGGDDPFATSLTVEDEGAHAVEFRSRDEAGNLEVKRTVGFTIEAPTDVRDVFAGGTEWSPRRAEHPVRPDRHLALRPAGRAVPARRVAGAAGRRQQPGRR